MVDEQECQAMQASKISSEFYRICEWIWRLAYINILWMLASLAGLVVFGLLPATVAMFAVLRKWVMKELDIPVFQTFINTYRKEFIKANALGLILLSGGYIIYFNYLFLATVKGSIHTVLLVGQLCTLFIYLITVFFIFPVYVHYELKLLQYVKLAAIIGIVNPLTTIALALSFVLLYHIFYIIPGLISLYSVSVTGFAIMWLASIAFSNFEKRQKKILNREVSQ